ncbi:unnamed protein product [Bursaphelenchus okinawaensis]|uniref:Uncharacterized protein n=1 Tax=Bursaphelenchus okinawaensis TaxID=465554 RepID=A0A811LLH9_9BILA|nr:unnamed protein product [Bursaphelenchus okinawaensis]CAG9124043.1 unnamed protein product [Bursaphelenchus okinawaensis]
MRYKRLYYVYYVIMILCILALTFQTADYVEETVDSLLTDPRQLGSEYDIWQTYDEGVRRVIKIGVMYFMMLVHLMIFYVYRDYCFVCDYPKGYEHS